MSYQIYKMIHVISIVLFFSGFAAATVKKEKSKLWTIVTGIALVFILVSGMGLLARLGISHKGGWPLWAQVKLAIWFVVGIGGHVVLKRFPRYSSKMYWVAVIFLGLASFMANYKIS